MTDAVDINAYWGGWPYWPVTVRTPADLLTLLDANGIQYAAMSSLKAVFVDCVAGNADLATLSAASGGRVLPYLVVNPLCEAEAVALVDGAAQGPFVGFSLFPMHHGYGLDEDLPALAHLLDRAAAWGWTVLVPLRLAMHFWLPVLPLASIVRLAERHPGVTVILGAVNYESRAARAALRRLPNLYVELSADAQIDAVTDYVAAGPDRVLLGTGLVLQQPAPALAKVHAADLSPAVHAAILRGNAARLLRLPGE